MRMTSRTTEPAEPHSTGPGVGRIDLRVSTIPTLHGEDMAIRLLVSTPQVVALDQLGMSRRELNELTAMLDIPGGLILVSGPTGIGQDDDALCVPAASEQRRAENPHDRRPDRVRRSRAAAVADQPRRPTSDFPSCCGACSASRPT